MATNVGYANGLVNGQAGSAFASIRRFLLHFVEMDATDRSSARAK